MDEVELEPATLKPCTPIPAYNPTFIIVLQVCVSTTSLLSMLGAILIIATFVFFKSLRTRARQILVQLSIADFGVATSQLIGVNVNLQKYGGQVCSNSSETDNFINITDVFCKAQGGITTFFTISSYLWTIAVAVYLLTVIVFESQKVGKWLTVAFYPLCWGISAVVVITWAIQDSFGFHANVDKGWCSLRTSGYNASMHTVSVNISEVFAQVFVYMTYITLLVIYIFIRCSIRLKIKRVSKSKKTLSLNLRSKAKNVDLKLTFIPIIFIILRIWGTILGIMYLYLRVSTWSKFQETRLNAALVLFAAVGSSAQGLTNFLLFCVFTSMVRQKLVRLVKSIARCTCCNKHGGWVYLLEPSTNFSDGAEKEVADNSASPKAPGETTTMMNNRQSVGISLFNDSINTSKYHSVSVGKRVTLGTE